MSTQRDISGFLPETKEERLIKLLRTQLAPSKIETYKRDPVLWVREKLPSVVIWDGFIEAMESVRDNPETLFQSANAIGKSFFGSVVLLWYMDNFSPCKIITTGSNWRALKEHVWPYAHALIKRHGLFPDAGPFDILDMAITLPGDRRAYAASTNDPEGIAGAHSENLLQIVEEASGIEQPIAEAIQGNARGEGSRTLWMYNPLRPSGPVYDKARVGRTKLIKISALDHPNVKEGKELIRGAVVRADVERDAIDWCTPCAPQTPGAVHLSWLGVAGWFLPSPVFMARDLGEFPEIDLDALISATKINECAERQIKDTVPTALGIDVARSEMGDETTFALANDSGIVSVEAMRTKDLVVVTGRALEILKANPTVHRTAVDDVGLGGGVTNNLQANGISVLPVNFGDKPTEKEDTFLNLKAQLYWYFKDLIEREPGYSIPNDPLLIEQIKAFKPDFGMSGHKVKVKIEDKAAYKKRMGFSPDRAEACIYAAYAARYANLSVHNDVYNEPEVDPYLDYEESRHVRHESMFR